MTAAIEGRERRLLVFDGDGSQFCPGGEPCSICNVRQTPTGKPRAFVRVRKRLAVGTWPVAQLCPDCICRALLQVERLGLWGEVSPAIRAAIRRMLTKRTKLVPARSAS